MGKKKTDGELRVVGQGARGHALMWYATVQGSEVYAGPARHEGREIFRLSYHATGQNHMHVQGFRDLGTPGPPPEAIVGVRLLCGGSLHADDWSYQIKPDTARRQTLVLPIHQDPSWTVHLWSLEPSYENRNVEQWECSRDADIHGRLELRRPRFHLLAIVSTITTAAVEGIMRGVKRER